MPTIITLHIANSSARWRTSQGGVIIQADARVIGPYMSRAIGTIHAQQRSGTMIRSAARAGRSRCAIASTSVTASADDALRVPVHAREVGVRLLEVERD